MKVKRTLLLVVLCMSVLLMGCGGSDVKPDTDRRVIEVKETVKVSKVTAHIPDVAIEEGIIKIPIYWQHWASNDKLHFSFLAYQAVYQGDEHLELVDGAESMNKQIDKGVDGLVELKYKLLDEETPVTIKIIATTSDAEEGTVTVDISQD